jgi:Uma2 family endonuclease
MSSETTIKVATDLIFNSDDLEDGADFVPELPPTNLVFDSDDLEDGAAFAPELPPTNLIFDDGEPLESLRHGTAMNVLIRSLEHAWRDRTDFYTGGNMFVYFNLNQLRNRDFRGPDFFVVLDVDGTKERKAWVLWEEGGRYPDVIVEFLSDSTAATDKGEKKQIYEQTFRTPDYFVFDPFEPNSLEGWHLNARHYQSLEPNDRGWLWCEALDLWLGTWEGTIQRQSGAWLRFFDQAGNVLLLPEEAAQQRAEEERQRAEEERQRAEEERQRAEEERQRAAIVSQELDQERQRSQRLAERLRELGLDPKQM